MAGEGTSNPRALPPKPSGWRVATVGDLCEAVTSGGTPLRSNPEFFVGGRHDWFKTGELNDSVLFGAAEKITDEALNQSSAKLFPKDTVLMAMYGDGDTITSLGMLASEAATNQACCAMIANRAVCEPRFLFYALRFHRQDFIRLATGGAQRNLSGKLVRRFALNVPPLSEQRAIVHILGTLDDRIELNRRMSETLEAIARALFRSWFVDFDPVRAKAEGRDPGLPQPLADHFPDSFEDSELGEIPKGWEVSSVERLCDSITSGGTPARMNSLFWEGGSIPWFKTGELLDGPLIESEEHITPAALDGSSCKLWPAGTILFALYASPTVGRLGVLTRPGTSNQAAAGLIAKSTIGVPFLRRLLLDARVRLQMIAVGAAQQNINQAVLKAHRAVIPNEKVASAYSQLVVAADERQVALAKEANALAALRDTLLPKLISGELQVRAAEELMQVAV